MLPLLGTALLSACGGNMVYAPVSERRAEPTRPKIHLVRAGDTLYSIAWQTELDYRDLARWNRIPPPYLIKPGKRLRLYRPAAPQKDRPKKNRAGAAKSRPAKRKTVNKEQWPKVTYWTWPTTGRVIRRFSRTRGRKGIDIAGRAGQPIRAAAAGKVVYRGSGLRGYGQLIIIKHNETFLSAYAHNEKIFISEGAWVRRGQKIAAMGNSGTNRTKLHFEIRRHGGPVNPLHYLPKRRL